MIRGVFIRIISNTIGLFLLDYIFQSTIQITNTLRSYILCGIVLAIINLTIKPTLNILSLPLKMVVIGITSLILNIVIFYIFVQIINWLDIDTSIQIAGFYNYILIGIAFTIINAIISWILKK